jgi:hypothetical protein
MHKPKKTIYMGVYATVLTLPMFAVAQMNPVVTDDALTNHYEGSQKYKLVTSSPSENNTQKQSKAVVIEAPAMEPVNEPIEQVYITKEPTEPAEVYVVKEQPVKQVYSAPVEQVYSTDTVETSIAVSVEEQVIDQVNPDNNVELLAYAPKVQQVEQLKQVYSDSMYTNKATAAESKMYSFTMKTGLLRPQINALVEANFPSYTVFWHDEVIEQWLGEHTIQSDDRWEILNETIHSYGITLTVTKNGVLEFFQKSPRG